MSGNGNSPAKFPAGRALVSFGAGCCVTGACMAGLAALMAQQGLSQDAAWPMATCAVSAGSLFSGWLMAFWQKSRGLLCGVVQGALFVFLLLCFGLLSGSPLQEMQLVRFGVTLLFGCIGGVLGILQVSEGVIIKLLIYLSIELRKGVRIAVHRKFCELFSSLFVQSDPPCRPS